MTRTEFLFGHPPEKYAELLEPLAEMRIQDANELLRELVPQKTYDPALYNQEQKDLATRISEVMEAMKLWEKIRDDGKD